MSEDLRYPIGRFAYGGPCSEAQRAGLIFEITSHPIHLRKAVEGLTREQLDTPYRPEGWTVRQVVHHLADSHMNSYIRFKLALTEAGPTIKPYDERAWAELADSRLEDVGVSLDLLAGLHRRWGTVLSSMDAAAFRRTLVHPESGTLTLDHMLGLYAWHGKHHLMHILNLKKRLGW